MASTLITVADTTARDALSPAVGDTVYQIDNKKINVCSEIGPVVWYVYNSDFSSPYDLDGTNSMTVTPLFHFDAALVNGADATGNPADEAAFSGQWTSRVNGKTTVAQGTISAQPTYYTSGENSEPYFSFDGGDFLNLTEREYCATDLTVLIIAKATTNAGFFPISSKGEDADTMTGTFLLGGNGIFYGYGASGVLLFWSLVANGYPGVTTHATGKDYDEETRGVIFRRNASGGTSYIDGDNAGSLGTNAADNDVRIGSLGRGNVGMNGFIYEIALFDSYVSDANLNSWGAYVTTKYDAGTGAMESQTSF
jgi:hypothetical protein